MKDMKGARVLEPPFNTPDPSPSPNLNRADRAIERVAKEVDSLEFTGVIQPQTTSDCCRRIMSPILYQVLDACRLSCLYAHIIHCIIPVLDMTRVFKGILLNHVKGLRPLSMVLI